MHASSSLSARVRVGPTTSRVQQQRNPSKAHVRKPLPSREHKATIMMVNDISGNVIDIQSDNVARRSFLQSVFLAAAGTSSPMWLPDGCLAQEVGRRATLNQTVSILLVPVSLLAKRTHPSPGLWTIVVDAYGTP
eukprot:1195374-Prorocentrum_minimum.AAC.2